MSLQNVEIVTKSVTIGTIASKIEQYFATGAGQKGFINHSALTVCPNLHQKTLKKRVLENETSFPDIKVIDRFVYYRTEHYLGDEVQESECWKLWIPLQLQLFRNITMFLWHLTVA